MQTSKRLLICLLLASAVGLLATAGALAAGPSAGDQQYIDPLGGSHSSGSSGSSSNSSGSTSSSPSQSTSSSAPATSSATTVASAPANTTSTSSTTSSASSSQSSATSTSASLPRTGFDAWQAVAFGVLLLASGIALRWVVRRT